MEEVLRRFARLAGLTVEEAEQWQDLCGDAYVLLESQTNIHYIKMLQVKLILP